MPQRSLNDILLDMEREFLKDKNMKFVLIFHNILTEISNALFLNQVHNTFFTYVSQLFLIICF